MGKQRFKALLFDFDETLVPEYQVANTAIQELREELQESHPSEHDIESLLFSTADRVFNESPIGEAAVRLFGKAKSPWYAYELVWDDKSPLQELAIHLGEFRRRVWTDTFRTAGFDDIDLAHAMSERLPLTVHERRVPYLDSDQVLTALGQRHPMAILTNGEPQVQAMKIQRSGLKHHFDHVVLCEEHRAKPDPLPFQVAMNLLGCEPGEVAMIGNSIANDIAGARNAGIFSVWVDRKMPNESPTEEVQPDATVENLSELIDLL